MRACVTTLFRVCVRGDLSPPYVRVVQVYVRVFVAHLSSPVALLQVPVVAARLQRVQVPRAVAGVLRR